jgi:exosortase
MNAVMGISRKSVLPWPRIAGFGVLLFLCYAPILKSLVLEWLDNADMGHGFFVPLIAGYVVWQQREELAATEVRPNWWGMVLVIAGGLQMIVATLGVELFLSRTAFIVTLIGMVWTLGGNQILKKVAFPLFLLFFMVPIPAIIYNRITFPLQMIASKLAEIVLSAVGIPVLREGNILELPTRSLSVVEACSGIRSLLSLTFLSLVYGYFFDKRNWMRITLFAATVPIAILANGGRVALTGILSQIKPDLAEGFFHESTGWVIFMIALFILVLFHQALSRGAVLLASRRKVAHDSAE